MTSAEKKRRNNMRVLDYDKVEVLNEDSPNPIAEVYVNEDNKLNGNCEILSSTHRRL